MNHLTPAWCDAGKHIKNMTPQFTPFPKMADIDRSLIPLTNGGCAMCSEDDFDELSRYSWFHVIDRNQEYAARLDGKRLVRMHNDVLGGKFIDHKNGDGLDNRLENLRFATNAQNQMNRGKFAKAYSRHKGVSWHIRDKRWVSKIKANGKQINLGNFLTEDAAAKAYDEAALLYFGDFARINNGVKGCMA